MISDMMMPHTTGAEFAREVATWMPELPFIFISGYTEDVAAQAGAVASDGRSCRSPSLRRRSRPQCTTRLSERATSA